MRQKNILEKRKIYSKKYYPVVAFRHIGKIVSLFLNDCKPTGRYNRRDVS